MVTVGVCAQLAAADTARRAALPPYLTPASLEINLNTHWRGALVVHGFKAVGGESAYVVNAPTELYRYEKPDEFRIPYDSPEIPYNWDVKMG